MKDFINPALLVLVLVLLLCGALVEDAAIAGDMNRWVMIVCVTMVIVDYALAFARALTHRPAVAKVVWGTVYIVVGCFVFLLPRPEGVSDDPAESEFQAMLSAYRETGDATSANAVGDTLLSVAAAMGKRGVVRELLAADPAPEHLARAMQRASENGHLPVVKLLLPKVQVNGFSDGVTPLIAASSFGRAKVVEYLLENGADPNLKDETGMPPLVHAVLADSAPVVKLLLEKGGDPAATDASGRNAASYSRREDIDRLLGGGAVSAASTGL